MLPSASRPPPAQDGSHARRSGSRCVWCCGPAAGPVQRGAGRVGKGTCCGATSRLGVALTLVQRAPQSGRQVGGDVRSQTRGARYKPLETTFGIVCVSDRGWWVASVCRDSISSRAHSERRHCAAAASRSIVQAHASHRPCGLLSFSYRMNSLFLCARSICTTAYDVYIYN